VRLERAFFARDAVSVARDLVGCRVVHGDLSLVIAETEAYMGEEDTACHAHRGRTKRTEVLYRDAGTLYVYLCYGMHWLMNVVVSQVGVPQCVLIRAGSGAKGPGLFTRALKIDGSLNGASILTSEQIWIGPGETCEIEEKARVGIAYAAPEDRARLWRFVMKTGE
jgi:DNA-3-methyladenine glycosylase